MIRDARREDAEQMTELFKIILMDMELPIMEKVTWKKLKPALVEAAGNDRYRHSFKNAIVKEIDGKVVGLCYGYKGGDGDDVYEPLETMLKEYHLPLFEPYTDSETFKGEWYLDTLVTSSEYRGQGIGKDLMDGAYNKARSVGMSVIGLNVDHDNPRARKLYERQGFKKTGEVVLADHRYDHMQKQI